MQSFENRPESPIKRHGIPLNVDTGYKDKGKGEAIESPPRTPTVRSTRPTKATVTAANKALRLKTSPRETFLDDITPIDRLNKEEDLENGRVNRGSHDLSLSPRQVTRDSLVDNMLLSLDQLAAFSQDEEAPESPQHTPADAQVYSSFAEEDPRSWTSYSGRGGRAIGHGYSYSSDYENADDTNRYPDRIIRSCRSNSSSNFQTNTGRMNSVEGGRGPSIPPRKSHSRGGKGSKGSSFNSIDLGNSQVQGNQRWGHGLGGRASSFDFGSDRHATNAQSSPTRQANTSGSTFNAYDYDAAPTPTVPGGPRRTRPASPIFIPQQEPAPVDATQQRLEHKRSTRSSKSAYTGKSSMAASSGMRYDYNLHDQNQELPPLPAFNKESAAPAPLVGYGKSKDQASSSQGSIQQTKDRPGFFRRVFGSSKNNASAAAEPPRSHGSTTSNDTTERPSSKPQHIASQMKSHNTPPSREPPPTPKEHAHTLTKRPSAFFRRRKKSVSEPEAPVPVPMAPAIVPPMKLHPDNRIDPRSEDSPVSSLRQVMNPYLRSPGRSPLDSHPSMNTLHDDRNDTLDADHRNVRRFSPDHELDKNATIRAVKANSRGTILKSPTSVTKPAEPAKADIPTTEREAKDERAATFLRDSSDNDPDSRNANLKTSTIKKELFGSMQGIPKLAPASVAKDKAAVAEYEGIHSKRLPITADQGRPVSSTKSPRNKLRKSKSKAAGKDEDWIMLSPNKSSNTTDDEQRVWLEPSSSEGEEEDLGTSNNSTLFLPKNASGTLGRTADSSDTVYKSASSLPIVQVEGSEEEKENRGSSPPLMSAVEAIKALDELQPSATETSPTEDDRDRAKKIYDGNEESIQKYKAAAWLGEKNPAHSRTLTAYIELYNFTDLHILAALRSLCSRLVLKAESQQVDRILSAFASRWCESNPNHGFKAFDVVHTICYSILLLNTDLHLADIEQKMTRSQFVKNTMPTIRRSVVDAAPDAFESNRPSVLPGKAAPFDRDSSGKFTGDNPPPVPAKLSIETERPAWRASFKPPPLRHEPDTLGNSPTPLDYDTGSDDCGPLVKAPFYGTLRTWEVQVEIILKDFYNSIRSEQLPLSGATNDKTNLQAPSSSSLTVLTNGMLRRTPSVLSKAPSETHSYARGRTAETMRAGGSRWSNKNRSRSRLYPGSVMGSSRTSLDDQSSMWSPSVSSSTWSKYSLGKTQTSMSMDSLGRSWPQADYQQAIGFANALSQAIIREETTGIPGSDGSEREELRVTPLLEDESLGLAGAPWAKEGIVKHKHHLESLHRKAKHRNWNETFAVIENGYMSLFSFSTKSMRKSKSKATGGVVGGGNWLENAENLGSFLLRQTIASALPPPGYSKARPHVWALSLPTGAVHLFQVGTPEIVKEFVSTANYWSARLSNHPLVGGISNIEYGWSDSIINNPLVTAINEATARPSTSGPRPSLQSSIRSSLDQNYGGGVRSRLPGDRIIISDWTPPTQSMRASNLLEPDQLKTLQAYVVSIEEELQKHNQLRNSMLLAFTPRHPNAQKAMANWEKKSSYLLREIVKFRTYIDSLQGAEVTKQRIYAERPPPKMVEAAIGEAELDEDEGDDTLKPE